MADMINFKNALAPIQETLANIQSALLTKDDLESSISELKTYFQEELAVRDSKIRELQKKVDTLQKEIISKNNVPVSNSCPAKKQLCLAIVGDSIVKYVDTEKICPGKQNIKKCIPGARVGDVRRELTKIGSSHEPEHLVLCAGTNHIPSEPPKVVARKVMNLVLETKELMPTSKIYLSAITPKHDPSNTEFSYLDGIKEINERLRRFCKKVGVDLIYNSQFWDGENINLTLLAKDGLHLSKKGVATLGSNIKYRMRKAYANQN